MEYPKEELIADARRIFKVNPEVVAGALAHRAMGSEIGVNEARGAIRAWLRKKPK